MKHATLWIGAIFMLAVACDPGTGPTNEYDPFANVPPGQSLVTMDIQGTKPATLAKSLIDSAVIHVTDASGAAVGSITLTDALVALKEIELENDEEEDSLEMEIEFEGPFVVDLITNLVTPSLDTVTIDTGVYTQIELKLDKIEGDEDDEDGQQLVDTSDALFGYSVYIAGTYSGTVSSGDVVDIPFIMAYELDETFELSTVDPTTGVADTSLGFGVEEGQISPIIIAFRLAKWFDFANPETNGDQVSFADLVVSQDNNGNDIILLDEDSEGVNDEVRDVVKENIKESADYGEDKDGNGELESDEDDDPDDEDNDDD